MGSKPSIVEHGHQIRENLDALDAKKMELLILCIDLIMCFL